MVLITGASGTVGGAVLDAMRKTGAAFRAMYRSEADARNAPVGVSTTIADFSNQDSLRSALHGVDTVFLVCAPVPALVELECNMLEAARAAGVKHIVLNSALGAEDYPKSFPSWHRAVEDQLKASRLAFTMVRPNSFMQNIVAFNAPSIKAQGAFYSALGDARLSYLDVRDIGAAIANILMSPAAHAGKTYELDGPEAVTSAEVAERISRIVNRPVKFVNIPEEAQRKSMLDLGMPEWLVTALLELQQYYVQGQGGNVTDVLAGLIGRPPVMLNPFLTEFKEQF